MKITKAIELLKQGGPICRDCAHELGAKCGGPSTHWSDTCMICNKKKMCNAVTDWHWPKKLGIGYVWD